MPITSLDLEAHLAPAGSPAASLARLGKSLWTQPYLSPALLEICRLLLARLHRDDAEIAADNSFVPAGTLPREKRALLLAGKTYASEHFTGAEKAVLGFAESYGLDAGSITDGQATAVSAAIGESGLVFLIEALGCLDGRIRARGACATSQLLRAGRSRTMSARPRASAPPIRTGDPIRDSALGRVAETVDEIIRLNAELWRHSLVSPTLLEITPCAMPAR